MHRFKTTMLPAGNEPVEWRVSDGLIDYNEAVALMEQRVQEISTGEAKELIWLLEHPPLFTAGTSAKPSDLLWKDRFPVYKSGRGGQYTYHGPGQRIVYVMLDVKRRTGDVRAFVGMLEAWVIAALAALDVHGETRADRVGVWVQRHCDGDHQESSSAEEDKVAAIGIRVRKWISLHGIAINAAPDLEHFGGIVPCGVREHGVTSLAELGKPVNAAGDPEKTMRILDQALESTFRSLIGPIGEICRFQAPARSRHDPLEKN